MPRERVMEAVKGIFTTTSQSFMSPGSAEEKDLKFFTIAVQDKEILGRDYSYQQAVERAFEVADEMPPMKKVEVFGYTEHPGIPDSLNPHSFDEMEIREG